MLYYICSIQVQQLDLEFHEWGGRRDGAGRPRAPGRESVPHRRRERHRRAHPVHVTLRARAGLPPFRGQSIAREMRRRIAEANASKRLHDVFRVVHFSVQDNHVHMIVEATDGKGLARGVQGLAIRLARRVNAMLGIRGSFWGERFHSRELASPRSVRNAIVYVLMNAKKHGYAFDVDPCSSAPWFDGFASHAPRDGPAPTQPSTTWLGATGWRRRGLVRLDERPRMPD